MSSAVSFSNPSSALVHAPHFEMISAGKDLLSAQLAIKPEDMRAIQKGITMYFDPEQNEKAAQWIEKNRHLLQDITKISRQTAAVQSKIGDLTAEIDAVTEELAAVDSERASVQSATKEVVQTFEERRGKLSEALIAARESLAQEHTLALLPFNNPLTHRAGRIAVAAGQYALAAAIPTVAYGQQELLKANCSNTLSGSPLAALSCASTLTDPRVYLSLAAGAGVSLVCKKGMDVAKRILEKEKEAALIRDSLQDVQSEHQRTVAELESQAEQLNQRGSAGLESLESAQKHRTELDSRREKLHERISVLRNQKMQEIAHTQLGLLREAMEQPEQGSFVRRAGEAAVNTLLDSVVVTYASHQPQHLAIAGSSEPKPLTIEEVDE